MLLIFFLIAAPFIKHNSFELNTAILSASVFVSLGVSLFGFFFQEALSFIFCPSSHHLISSAVNYTFICQTSLTTLAEPCLF